MSEWIPFEYREFYDVPRRLILVFRGRTLLLESLFIEKDDEYSNKYMVYELPISIRRQLTGSWESLASQAISYLGEMPIDAIEFDATRRREINGDFLEGLPL